MCPFISTGCSKKGFVSLVADSSIIFCCQQSLTTGQDRGKTRNESDMFSCLKLLRPHIVNLAIPTWNRILYLISSHRHLHGLWCSFSPMFHVGYFFLFDFHESLSSWILWLKGDEKGLRWTTATHYYPSSSQSLWLFPAKTLYRN